MCLIIKIFVLGQEVDPHLNIVDRIACQVQSQAQGQVVVQGHDLDPDPGVRVSTFMCSLIS